MSLNKKFTENNYLRPDEIDARNIARLMAILDKWETGGYAHVLFLLHDVYEVIQTVNPLHWHTDEIMSTTKADSFGQKYIKQEREEFIPYIRPAFLPDLNSDEVKSSLSAFKQKLDDGDGELSSFDIAALIFLSISIDGDGGHNALTIVEGEQQARQIHYSNTYTEKMKYPNPFHRSIASMREESKKLKTESNKADILKPENPESEESFRKRLEPHIQALRTWCTEQGITGQIIGHIAADASGSASFRPHVFNYNFLRDCPEKDELFEKEATKPNGFDEDHFFDFTSRKFTPDHSFHKEYAYPAPIAYVMTYSLTFHPSTSADLEKMKTLLSKTFEILSDVELRFGNPIHYSSAKKYVRPDTYLPEKDGALQPQNHVDLDDLFNLYYLLEDYIIPSPSTARTLNAASHVEG